MFFLLLSVLCSTLLGFIFKLFPRFGVDTFQAIVFNYFTCVACATLHQGAFPIQKSDFGEAWMPYALGLGFVFISGFNCAALTVRHFGVTVSQIMQKMTLMLSVPFAILWYSESAGAAKIAGVVLALASIVLVNWPRPKNDDTTPLARNAAFFAIPFLTWILAAVIDIVFIRVQKEGMIQFGDVSFISTVFGTAGTLGLAYALFGWATGRLQFSGRNVAAGILLGIPNYGSMLFILLALGSGMEGSLFFPLNNVGIILATTFGAVLLFRERLSAINWAGIAVAVAAIVLISV